MAAEHCRYLLSLRTHLILLLFALPYFSAAGVSAQSAASGLYEGLEVSTINLVAQPSVNVEAFRPVVVQKAGAPYSAADIQKSIAALDATGKFTKVNVEVSPETQGLRVTFLLEPVYYVGVIYFSGSSNRFTYQRLLEVVNYPRSEPYQESRAVQGEQLLKRFLAQQGYFMAQVKVQTALDDSRKLANLTYYVTLNRRARLGSIGITGPPPAEATQLVGAVRSLRAWLRGARVRAGNHFDPARLQAATRFLQNFLGRQGYLANTVRLDRPAYDPETNLVAMRWQVTIGPKVVVSVTGARVSRRSLRSLVPIYEENAFDQDLVEEGQRNLLSHFQGKGYDEVKITSHTTQDPSEISLTYQVDLGMRRRVAKVGITGNRHFDDKQLASQIVVRQGRFLSRGKFNDDLLNRSVRNLVAYYHNAGYQDVTVKPHVTERAQKVDVTFQIEEGSLTLVEKLNVVGNKSEPIDKLAPDGLKLAAGAPYSRTRLDKDRGQIIARYLDLGYPNATLRWTVEPAPHSPGRVVVTYEIEEGTRVYVSDVAVVGEKRTRVPFIEHNTNVKAGEPLSETTVLGSESALYNLGIFDSATVDPRAPITNQTEEQVLVRVHEASRNSLSYGFGMLYTPVAGSLSSGIVALPGLPTLGLPSSFKVIEKTVFSPLGSIDYSRLNIMGRAETASASAFISLLDQRGSVSYSDRQFMGLNWSSLVSLSAERSAQNPLFTARLGTASFQLERVLNAAKTERLQFSYTFQRTSLTNLLILDFVPPGDENVRSSMLAASFIRDTRDNVLDAHRGVFETVNLGISPKIIGSTDDFARFFGQASYYRRVQPWMVWANNVRLGLVDAFAGSHVPISEKFFSGGASSLRGFPLNGAGPQVLATLCTEANNPESCTQKITAPGGGLQLFIFNSEGRFPIPINFPSPIGKNLGGVLFYDGGNVYQNIGFKNFISDYSNTVGFGLRYSTPIGPVRLDIGHNLNPVPGFKATNIFVTLGQSF